MLLQLTDQACVWMRAGVIRFWLCDRSFDCENCPLDAALRGSRAHGPRRTPSPPRDPSATPPTGDPPGAEN